jgi:transketolase
METIECWEHALKSSKTPSILSLTRQNLDPIRKKVSNTNKCSFGAYEVLRTNKKIHLTILASGSEVNLAIETSHKLAKDKIYSKVISMPCQDLFDKQSNAYQQKIINETKIKISIEAASTDCWKKYVDKNGLSFGIDTFGKSAPYKEIYKHFGLTAANIARKSKKLFGKKI